MRADDDVNAPIAHFLQNPLLLGRCTEARKHLHLYGKLVEAPAEDTEMLLGKYSSRHEDGCLFSVHHSLERGANGNFSLAVADIADNDSVHRAVAFHVTFDVDDCIDLV